MKSGRSGPNDGKQGVWADACMRGGATEWHGNALPANTCVHSGGVQRGYEVGDPHDDGDAVMLGTACGAMSADMADAAGGMAAFDLQSMAYTNQGVLQDCPVRILSTVVDRTQQHNRPPATLKLVRNGPQMVLSCRCRV